MKTTIDPVCFHVIDTTASGGASIKPGLRIAAHLHWAQVQLSVFGFMRRA